MRRVRETGSVWCRGQHRAPRSQRGDLLIELLVAVALMSIVVVTGIMGLGVMVSATSTHQSVVRASNEAAIASEHVELLSYIPCGGALNASATAAEYKAKLADLNAPYVEQTGLDLELIDLGYLQDASAAAPVFSATCPAGGDQGLQRVVVRVETRSSNGSLLAGEVAFVKRNETCVGVPDTVRGQTC